MAAAATPFPWASVDPNKLSGSNPATLYNLVGGKWVSTKKYMDIIDPMNGEPFLRMPLTQGEELEAFVQSLKACPKSGLHNMYKKPERYNMWGAISARMAAELEKPEVRVLSLSLSFSLLIVLCCAFFFFSKTDEEKNNNDDDCMCMCMCMCV